MKKLLTTTLILALMLPVMPVWAGDEGHKQCPGDAADCARQMKEKFKERGWVGINMDYHEEKGVTVISNVVAHSPAEKAGFEVGDILLGLNGVDYTEENSEALKTEYASFKPGSRATFKVKRGGEAMDIEVELEQIPQAILAQWVGQHILEAHQGEAEVADAGDEEGDKSP
jgi:predicted metalloprotease with PDZ domain